MSGRASERSLFSGRHSINVIWTHRAAAGETRWLPVAPAHTRTPSQARPWWWCGRQPSSGAGEIRQPLGGLKHSSLRLVLCALCNSLASARTHSKWQRRPDAHECSRTSQLSIGLAERIRKNHRREHASTCWRRFKERARSELRAEHCEPPSGAYKHLLQADNANEQAKVDEKMSLSESSPSFSLSHGHLCWPAGRL